MSIIYRLQEVTIAIIQDFLMDYESPSFYFKRKKHFKSQTYLVWACHELIDLIKENRYEDPIALLDYFIDKMRTFSVINHSEDNPFEAALYVASNVLDTLQAAL